MLSCRLVVLWKRIKRSQLHFLLRNNRENTLPLCCLKFKGYRHLSRVKDRDSRDLPTYAVEPDSQLYLEVLQCSVADPWEGPGGATPAPPPPFSPFLDQSEARRAEKILEKTAPPFPPEFSEDYGINSSWRTRKQIGKGQDRVKLEVMQPNFKNKCVLKFQHMNKPYRISSCIVL